MRTAGTRLWERVTLGAVVLGTAWLALPRATWAQEDSDEQQDVSGTTQPGAQSAQSNVRCGADNSLSSADTVRRFLGEQGLSSEQITAATVGEDQPVCNDPWPATAAPSSASSRRARWASRPRPASAPRTSRPTRSSISRRGSRRRCRRW